MNFFLAVEKEDITEFFSEQVSHHPPVSASFTRAKKHGLTLKMNPTYLLISFHSCLASTLTFEFVRFGVKLGSNSAGVSTAGAAKITTPIDTYELSKVD